MPSCVEVVERCKTATFTVRKPEPSSDTGTFLDQSSYFPIPETPVRHALHLDALLVEQCGLMSWSRSITLSELPRGNSKANDIHSQNDQSDGTLYLAEALPICR